ncbi:glycerate kinase [Slackia heliotrinireducens]|uniref:glycerate kinase n=1 Tax=Slackia heliotrinireducens TaxID=84110 RepID=UPI0033161807
MKLVFASDSFKGSLSSARTAELLTQAAGFVFGDCECVSAPMADGGEGTVDAVLAALCGKRITVTVFDPLMRSTCASYGILPDGHAVIEMAAASGLTLVEPDLRNPLMTSTFGTGQLILAALDQGCRNITVGLGGSATNDGGMGCIRALGGRFVDARGHELRGCGRDLGEVSEIDMRGLDSRLGETSIAIMSDVTNPLCGPEGATYIYGRQKGATSEMLEQLERGMQSYSEVIRERFHIDCNNTPGAGAAGGLGAALMVFLGGRLQSGIECLLDLIGFDSMLEGADLVVTGEGRADAQSSHGKTMQGVARRATTKGIPVYALVGSIGEGAEALLDDGILSFFALQEDDMPLDYAMAHAEQLYADTAVRLFRSFRDAR